MSENIIPDWEKAVQTTNSNSIMFEIPFKQNAKSSALLISKRDSIVTSSKKVKVESSLVIQKFPEIDTVRYFVVTVLGEYIGNEDINKANPFSYNGDRKGFNGYVIISDLDGCVLDTYYYAKGGRKHVRIRPETEVNAFSKYTIIRMAKKIALTKGGGYESGEEVTLCDIPGCTGQVIDQVCNLCGARYIGGAVVEDDPEYCSECDQLKGQCICCSVCHRFPCICNNPVPCTYCGDPYCNGECQNFSFCPNCGIPLIDGICPQCNGSGGDGGDIIIPPTEDTLYTLSLNVFGAGTVFGTGTYKKGTTASATAIPEMHSIFLGWTGFMTSQNPSISLTMNSNVSLDAVFKNITDYFDFDTNSNSPIVKNVFFSLLLNCAGKGLLDNIFAMYSNPKIEIVNDPTSFNPAAFDIGYHKIKWNFYVSDEPSTTLIILHELFHAFQHGLGYLEHGSKTINAEVEAHLAMYIYANKYGITDYLNGLATEWQSAFNPYLSAPTPANYNLMIDFVRSRSPAVYNETDYPDITSKRTTDNTSIFNCN